MGKGRLEAFSDGVIAVIITIMVLELKAPHGTDLAALAPVAPALFTYVLSFVYVGIYWNNHHHMLQAAQHIDGRVLWANLHLLFWLSLVPRSEEHTSELQSRLHLVCRLLLEKKKCPGEASLDAPTPQKYCAAAGT